MAEHWNKSPTGTTAQRRKGTSTPTSKTTVLVEEGGSADAPKVATVRRRFCGTGPFDKHWLNVDCCGLFCALFTYMLHLYAIHSVCVILLPPWMSYIDETGDRYLSAAGQFHRVAFVTIAIMAIVSHFKAMTTDPGAVPPDAIPLPDPDDVNLDESQQEKQGLVSPQQKVRRLCRRCKAFKPLRAHHCGVCNRCIIKMDHHCPWVNNCVGIGNHKYFLLFVFYTFISCCYSMILVIARFSTCFEPHSSRSRHRQHDVHLEQPHHEHHHCLDRPTQLLNILGLLIEGLLFGMFTSCMMCDQAGVVHTKLTHIDRLKGADIGGSIAGITEVFGMGRRPDLSPRFRTDWLSPFVKVCFPKEIQDEIMGFCQSCSRKKPETELSNKNGARSADEIV